MMPSITLREYISLTSKADGGCGSCWAALIGEYVKSKPLESRRRSLGDCVGILREMGEARMADSIEKYADDYVNDPIPWDTEEVPPGPFGVDGKLKP